MKKNMVDLATPQSEDDFGQAWIQAVLDQMEEDEETEGHQLASFQVRKNEVQGILSTTFIVDVKLQDDNGHQVDKSIFVKVPLRDPNVAFESVNKRELVMLTQVLPKLQDFLDTNCDGFFRLPMPKTIYCHYDGNGDKDVFVAENLLSDGFYNFSNDQCLNEDHMKAVIDCLCYLHATGLAFKHQCGSRKTMQQELFDIEEQIQLYDLIENQTMRQHFVQHFRPFLHFMEETEPALAKHTGYLKKMHKHMLKVIAKLEECGFESLITLAHGDAKPNNFMFRRIQIDLEELECEGIDTILIDWQGGFLGSVANDLMWAIFPFVESNRALYEPALQYYFDTLQNVLDTFHLKLKDVNIPAEFPAFASLVKRCLILEFLIVTVIKPVMSLKHPQQLRHWHKETIKNTRRRFKKQVVKPDPTQVFSSPRFTGFCQLYFKIATSMGAFQELGQIYFEIMKDSMFEKDKKFDGYDSDDEDDQDLVSRIINAPSEVLIKWGTGVCAVLVVAIGLVVAYWYWK